MSSAVVTRGYLFTPSLVVTAGYVAAEVPVPPEPEHIRFRLAVLTEFQPREPVGTMVQARSAVRPAAQARATVRPHEYFPQ